MILNSNAFGKATLCRFGFAREAESIAATELTSDPALLAENATDLIRGRPPLDPLDAPVHIAGDWETRQR
jgi:hypothetical protein